MVVILVCALKPRDTGPCTSVIYPVYAAVLQSKGWNKKWPRRGEGWTAWTGLYNAGLIELRQRVACVIESAGYQDCDIDLACWVKASVQVSCSGM